MTDSNVDDFLVRRANLNDVRWAPAQTRIDEPLAEGEALLRVDRYAFTANNITYGLVGEIAHYWDFFPTEEGWGRIPVWGHADVVASRVPDLAEGQRVFGYLPMSALLKVRPERVTAHAFHDGSEHRRHLPAIYQSYARAGRDDLQNEDLRALIQPLFATGWLIDDWLVESELFGAKQILIASASSKTALCTAFMLSQRAARTFEVVGLTAARNQGFCERVGYYDRVIDYKDVRSLPAMTPTVFVDMAGDAVIRRNVHEHFRDALRYDCMVGLTHGSAPAPEPLPGPAAQMFFAPTQSEKRREEWGGAKLEERLSTALTAFKSSALRWVELVPGRGHAAIEACYRRVLAGQVEPQQGIILSV